MKFNTFAQQKGLTLSNQVSMLLQFIAKQRLEDELYEFVFTETESDSDKSPLGLSKALESISRNSRRNLYRCFIGVYPTAEADIHIKEYEVFVAEGNVDDAIAEATYLVEVEHCDKHQGLSFAAIDAPESVNPGSYT